MKDETHKHRSMTTIDPIELIKFWLEEGRTWSWMARTGFFYPDGMTGKPTARELRDWYEAQRLRHWNKVLLTTTGTPVTRDFAAVCGDLEALAVRCDVSVGKLESPVDFLAELTLAVDQRKHAAVADAQHLKVVVREFIEWICGDDKGNANDNGSPGTPGGNADELEI